MCVCVRVCVCVCVCVCEDGSIQQVILWKFDRRRNTQTLNKEQNNHVSVLCYCAYIKEQRLHALER